MVSIKWRVSSVSQNAGKETHYKFSINYNVFMKKKRIKVCKTAFLGTYDVSKSDWNALHISFTMEKDHVINEVKTLQ